MTIIGAPHMPKKISPCWLEHSWETKEIKTEGNIDHITQQCKNCPRIRTLHLDNTRGL